MSDKLTLTVAEVADQLNVSKPLAYALCASADFPSLKIGERRIVVPTKAFEAWLERQTEKG